MKANETDMEAQSVWDIVRPATSWVKLPLRLIPVLVREVSSRDIIRSGS